MSCYGCSPSTGTNASSFPSAPFTACDSQQHQTQSCTGFHFRAGTSFCPGRPASQPQHPNTQRYALSSDASSTATRTASSHRHAGAICITSFSLAMLLPVHLCVLPAPHSTHHKYPSITCAPTHQSLTKNKHTPHFLTLSQTLTFDSHSNSPHPPFNPTSSHLTIATSHILPSPFHSHHSKN